MKNLTCNCIKQPHYKICNFCFSNQDHTCSYGDLECIKCLLLDGSQDEIKNIYIKNDVAPEYIVHIYENEDYPHEDDEKTLCGKTKRYILDLKNRFTHKAVFQRNHELMNCTKCMDIYFKK